jgi:hypothetical protein
MLMNISQAELTLLNYLNKHSGGADERIWLDPKPIAKSVGISANQLADNSASLAAHDFAGVRDSRPYADELPSVECSAIWITRKGKACLRGSPAK